MGIGKILEEWEWERDKGNGIGEGTRGMRMGKIKVERECEI